MRQIHEIQMVTRNQLREGVHEPQQVVASTALESNRKIDVTRLCRIESAAEQHQQIDAVFPAEIAEFAVCSSSIQPAQLLGDSDHALNGTGAARASS